MGGYGWLVIGWSIGTSVGGVLSYFGARWFTARFPVTVPTGSYAKCVDCEKPTGSPRLSECGACQSRRLLAGFDARVEVLEAHRKLMWAELGLDPGADPSAPTA
jgi:hypothetical protein